MVADFSQDVQEILRGFSVGSLAYTYRDSDTDLAIEVTKGPSSKKCQKSPQKMAQKRAQGKKASKKSSKKGSKKGSRKKAL